MYYIADAKSPRLPELSPYGVRASCLGWIGSGAHLFELPDILKLLVQAQHLSPSRLMPSVIFVAPRDRASGHIRQLN